MSGEAVAPQPQIGDVWTSTNDGKWVWALVDDVECDRYAADTAEPDGRDWTLVGRIVPVDHPGIEALRNFVDGRYSIGSVIDEHSALADLLALLASPGGPT